MYIKNNLKSQERKKIGRIKKKCGQKTEDKSRIF